jgi:SH3-like domain-containing protein
LYRSTKVSRSLTARLTGAVLVLAFSVAGFGGTAVAQTTGAIPNVSLGPSGLPLPRFVSLKASRVNSRIGPGLGYAVDWMYLKSGLPVEIIQEYDNWRRVRDSEGAEGWINQSLLSGRRTAIAAPWQRGKSSTIALMSGPRSDATEVARLEPGVVGTIKACDGRWCEGNFAGHNGWVAQEQVWGAYPGERFKD